jgi:hypothetical protein
MKLGYFNSHWIRDCCPHCGRRKKQDWLGQDPYHGLRILFGNCRHCHKPYFPAKHLLIHIAFWGLILGVMVALFVWLIEWNKSL